MKLGEELGLELLQFGRNPSLVIIGCIFGFGFLNGNDIRRSGRGQISEGPPFRQGAVSI
jgi:hypothetical protein